MAGILDNFQKMSELLTCPVCFEIPEVERTILCRNGHSACESCGLKIRKCVECGGCYTSTKNILAEILIQECTWNCIYEGNGCTRKLSLRDKALHSRVCEYGPVICKLFKPTDLIYESCEENVDHNHYLEHLCKNHMGTVSFEDNTTAELNQSLPYKLSSDTEIKWSHCPSIHVMHTLESARTNDYFLVVTDILDLTFYWWVYYLRPEFQNYWAAVTVKSPSSKMKLSFTGPMQSIQVSPDEVIQSGLCLSASRNTLASVANYCSVSDTTKWIVTIDIQNRQMLSNADNCVPLSLGNVDEAIEKHEYYSDVTDSPFPSQLSLLVSPRVVDEKDASKSKSSEYDLRSTSSSLAKSMDPISLETIPVPAPGSAPTSVSSSTKLKPLLEKGVEIIHIGFEANDVEGVGLCIIRNTELKYPVFLTCGPIRHGLPVGLEMTDYCIANAKNVLQKFVDTFSVGCHVLLQSSISPQLSLEQKADIENYLVKLLEPTLVHVTFRTARNKNRKQLHAITQAADFLLEREVKKCETVLRDLGIKPGEIVYIQD